jgi:hypothetical protein
VGTSIDHGQSKEAGKLCQDVSRADNLGRLLEAFGRPRSD